MTVRITKPEFNLREKLTELDYGRVPFQKMPTGSVIQYVQADIDRMTNRFTTSSTSYTATNYDFNNST